MGSNEEAISHHLCAEDKKTEEKRWERERQTFADEFVGGGLHSKFDPPPPLRVVAAAQVGHAHLTLLVHVHVAR